MLNRGGNNLNMEGKNKWKILYREQIRMGICHCYLCGKIIEKESDLTIEHKVPKSRGGTDWSGNLWPSCKKCNSEKGSLTIEEYKEWKRLEAIRNGNIPKKEK